MGEFSGSPGVRTPCFTAGDLGFNPDRKKRQAPQKLVDRLVI